MQINWKVRLRNKAFWLAIIPTILLLVQQVAALFGVALDLGEAGERLLAIVETAFLALATFGVVNDPTTAGAADSALAMTYEEPKPTGQGIDPDDTANLGRHIKRGA